MTAARAQPVLLHTPFHALHVELGARMVAFAGYDMPVQYPAGIMKEHLHVRAAAGLFDISHMGQFAIHPKNGSIEHTAEALEALVPADVIGLAVGRQRYALLTNEQGGVRDDLMIANLGDRFLVVANAACKDADEGYLRRSLAARCDVEPLDDRALLALQGPASEQVLAAIGANVVPMRFLDVKVVKLLDTDCIVCRSGYTGEDGFEISVPSSMAEPLARKLLADAHVIPVGRAPETACGWKPGFASMALIWTRRLRRSRPRLNGVLGVAAATAAIGSADFRVRRSFSVNSRRGWRGDGSGCVRKDGHRSAMVRRYSPKMIRAQRSVW